MILLFSMSDADQVKYICCAFRSMVCQADTVFKLRIYLLELNLSFRCRLEDALGVPPTDKNNVANDAKC